MVSRDLKQKARILRAQDKTYSEIMRIMGCSMPKSTLSYWCSGIKMSQRYLARVKKINYLHLHKARQKSVEFKANEKRAFFKGLEANNKYLIRFLKQKSVQKLLLSMLYWGEGSKYISWSGLRLGNSDPNLIKTYLKLLKNCFQIDQGKFRVRIQCRADQDIKKIERYWQNVTKINKKQFYPTWSDKRTKGKKTQKENYQGVCVIDYFDTKIQQELEVIAYRIIGGP